MRNRVSLITWMYAFRSRRTTVRCARGGANSLSLRPPSSGSPPLGLHRRPSLAHKRQGPAFVVAELGHPLLRAVGMPVEHVRGVLEAHAAALQVTVRGLDVRHPEIEDR